MTTERRGPQREARVRVSALELRLYVAALLAAVYAISWRAIRGQAPAAEPVAEVAAQRFVWLDSIPPTLRPAIALPAGWQVAASSSRPQPVIRAPGHRVPRVRTRSS